MSPSGPRGSEYLCRLFGLPERVALVTGARHGIGRAIALGLAQAGARIVSTSRDGSTLAELAMELEVLGAEHLELTLDVTDEAQVAKTLRTAAGHWGRLDVVVNNAGRSVGKQALDCTASDWDAVLNTNLRGVFLVSQAAAREMREHGGRIISLSSTFARAAMAGRAPYAASKAALEQMTRVLALEWAALGITVNAVAPATTPTETRRELLADESVRAARVRQIALGRLGEPEDVVGAVLLLAGDAGSFITGETILVDGGFTLGPASSS